MKKTTKQKWLTVLLILGALWMNGQGFKNLMPPCTPLAPACTNTAPSYERVCNGSFETYSTQVTGFAQLSKAHGWTSPAWSTPDLLTTSASSFLVNVPCNAFGYQAAKTGSAYAGIATAGDGSNPNGYAEYLQTLLNNPLSAGSIYEVSFWVSRADFMNWDNDRLDVFIDNSAAFTPVCLSSISPKCVSFDQANGVPGSAPMPKYTVYNSVLNDINNWVEIKFIYCGQGSETNLIIGNYYGVSNTPNTPTTSVGTCSLNPNVKDPNCTCYAYDAAYLYLDDVSIKDITPTLAFAPNGACQNTSINFSCTPQAGYIPSGNYYNWNFGDGSPVAAGGVNASHTYSASGSYTVTVTYTTASSIGCTPSHTTVVTVADCCINPNPNPITIQDVNIVAPGTSTLTWNNLVSGPTYSGNISLPSAGYVITGNYTVRGNLNINTPATFSLCNMAMNDMATINQYSTTVIDRSWIWGCSRLWNGIMSRNLLTITNSYIEDGYWAVNAGFFLSVGTHPGLTVDNVVFTKNYYSLIAGTCSMTPGNFKVTGSIFMCKRITNANHVFTPGVRYTSYYSNLATLTPTTVLACPTQGIAAGTKRSNIGIFVNNLYSNNSSPIRIGDVSDNPSVNATYTNKFDYINEGIHNLATKAEIYNNYFSNMVNTGYGNALGAIYHDDGTGNARNTSTKVGALGGGIYPTAHYKNVFGYGTTQNTVLDAVTAINGGTLDVSYNDFSTISRYGINVKTWYATNPANEPVTVSNNSFTNTAYAFYAYDNNAINAGVTANTLVHTAATYTNYYNVYINEINKPANTSYSINANNFSGSLYGVYVINTRNARVVNNTVAVKKPTSTGIYNAPVWFDNSDNGLIKGNNLSCSPSNATSWNTFGVFANASYSNTVKCNNITAVSACMKFQSNCNPTTIYYNSLNNTGGTDPCLYGIWLDNSGQTGNIGYNNGAQWQMSDDIWGDFSGADTYAQNTSIGYNIYYDPTKIPTTLYQPLVNNRDNASSFTFTPVSNSNINSQNCGEPARLMNGNGGKSLGTSVNPSGSLDNSGFETGNDELINNTYDKKRLFINVNNTSSNSNKVIKGANESGFYLVDSLIEIYTATKDLNILSTAKNANSAINALNNQEQNQKDFNSVYCVYLEDDSLVTTSQIQALQNMALLCPFTEGLAVYEARALVRNWDDSTTYYNVCENNLPENFGSRFTSGMASVNSENIITSVHPNPTNGNLLVSCSYKDCLLEVFDIAGRKILSQKLNESETKIDLSSLNNGTYLYKITNNGTIVKTDKLILNK